MHARGGSHARNALCHALYMSLPQSSWRMTSERARAEPLPVSSSSRDDSSTSADATNSLVLFLMLCVFLVNAFNVVPRARFGRSALKRSAGCVLVRRHPSAVARAA